MRTTSLIVLGLLTALSNAQQLHNSIPLHTFSIVARDSVTGEIGVAVQSHVFGVGRIVPWAEGGVGAVATQSFADPSYGYLGLQLMKSGKSAQQALDALLAADPEKESRQVAMIDTNGNVAVFTGSKCIDFAGHIKGIDYSVQANLMVSGDVWPAMAHAFESSREDLAGRMLAALDAAQAVGGDIRGQQSAAMVVVRRRSMNRPWYDKLIDIRVDDHPSPLSELRRLLQLRKSERQLTRASSSIAQKDLKSAQQQFELAVALNPQNVEARFWYAVELAQYGHLDLSIPVFRDVFSKEKHWYTLIPRLQKIGMLASDSTVQRILATVPKR